MNTEMLARGKTILNVLWVVLAASFFVPGGGALALLRSAFVALLLVHAIEFLFFYRTLARLGGSMGRHFVQVLLYGIIHLQLARAAAGEAPAPR